MLASDFGTGQVFLSMLWFFLFFIWIWLLITVFADIFRSHDMGGFAKFLWVIFVIFLPYLGVFVYLIARGHKMSEHAMEAAQAGRQHGLHPAGRRHRARSPRRRARTPRRPQGAGRDRRRRVQQDEGQDRQLTTHRSTASAGTVRPTVPAGGGRAAPRDRSVPGPHVRPAPRSGTRTPRSARCAATKIRPRTYAHSNSASDVPIAP